MINEIKGWLITLAAAIGFIVCIFAAFGSVQCIDNIDGCVNKAGSIRL